MSKEKEPMEALVDELLKVAVRISSSKISDSMKEAIFAVFLKSHKPNPKGELSNGSDDNGSSTDQIVFNNSIKRFMRTYKITEDQIGSLFHLEPDKVDYIIPELHVKNNKEGIHHCVLLNGVKNAIQSGSYNVILNEVRELAGNFGVYDSSNFSYHMKQNSGLLKAYKAGKDSELSGYGIKIAAEFIQTLTKS